MKLFRGLFLSIPLLISQHSWGQETLSQVEIARYKNLAQHYAPLVYLHPREPYFPTSIEKQIVYLSLFKKGGQLISKDLNMDTFTEFVQKISDTQNYELVIRKGSHKEARAGDLSHARCYTNPHKVTLKNKNYIRIPYLFYYAYNGIPRSDNPILDAIIKKGRFGVHEGDWEGIVVVLKENEELEGVYFSAHGAHEARYYSKRGTDLKKDDGYKLQEGRPIVFSALETHASYNRSGSLTRRARRNWKQKIASKLHILPPDRTGMGKVLDCREEGRLEDFNFQYEKTWAFFKGSYGAKAGPTGPAGKEFWNQ